MHHLLNFIRLQNKPLSQSLRIAADLIEDNHLNNSPESEWAIKTVFHKLNLIMRGIDPNRHATRSKHVAK